MCVFFFKQKTAYEMRISDWSSDVCSSDLKLRFRPELVSGKAVEALTRFVTSRDARTIELEIFAEDWRSERYPNDHTVVQRIVELCATPSIRSTTTRPRFLVKPLALAEAVGDYGNPMKPIIQKWRVSSGGFDDTTLPFVMRYGMSLNLSIFAAKTRSEPLCFSLDRKSPRLTS